MDLPADFGRYDLLSLVGKGAMGSVYRARHKALENIVAVKILHPQCSENRKLVERFITEAKAVGRLSHPNVVRGIDAGELDGRYFFVMEFVDGPPLDRTIAVGGRLAEKRALQVALDIAKALQHAAENRVVHRDVKPANILIGTDGRAKLTDLGLATRLDRDEKKPGGAMGTPDYISPEQIQALPDVDIRSDLYALGGTLFHMLTGHPPFSGDPTDVMARHLTEPFPDPRDEVPELSEGAVAILRRLTEKRREDRYQSPSHLVADLETVLAGGDVSARQAGRALASRRVRRSSGFNLGVAGLALAALVLCGLVVLVLTSGGSPPPEPAPDKPPPRKTEPDPGAGKLEQEARKAEEALAKARRFRETHPEDYDQAVRLFQQVARDYSTDWQAIALDEIAKVRDAREKKAEELVRGPMEAAAAEAGRERFGEGRSLLRAFLADRKAAFGETRAYGGARDALQDLTSRAEAFAGRLETEARQAIAAGHFDSARAAAERVRAADPDSFGPRAEALLREAAGEERKRAEAAQEREALDLLAQARGKARDAVRAGKVMEAVEAFENVRSNAKSSRVWRLAELEAQDLDRLAEFWKALGEAKDAAGREMTVGGKTGKVTNVSGGYVHILLGPARTAFRLQELKPDEVVRLAEIGLLPADAKWKRGLAVYCLYQDRLPKANELLKGLELTEEERDFYRGKAGG